MIIVTGATGQLGRLVIATLIHQHQIPANTIAAVVRNCEKANDLAALGVEVRVADYDNSEAWDQALTGAEKILLISSSEIGKRSAQHQTVIDAANRAQVKLLVYTSVLHADQSELGLAAEHRATEQALIASGLAFVVLRNGWYIENYMGTIAAALANGAVIGCAGNGAISAASRADYAEAAAQVLVSAQTPGSIYELAGDHAFTMADLAATLSDKSGQQIPYINLSAVEYEQALLQAGLPAPIAQLLADADVGISKGALFEGRQQLSTLIGRPSTPMADVVARVIAEQRSA